MRIAVVGTGISGLLSAHLLAQDHELTVFEQQARIGGHTHTHAVDDPLGSLAVDTGFIVYNEWTYPNFARLLRRLGVASQPSDMSFGVRDDATGLEYCASSLSRIFAQRKNLLSLRYLSLWREILRFGRTAAHELTRRSDDPTLFEYLEERGYSQTFRELFVVPMSAAIWSSERRAVLDGPARFFVRFFDHHGMLNIVDQPTWRVVRGGSSAYLAPLTKNFAACIRKDQPVLGVRRQPGSVTLRTSAGEQRFDQVVLACHSDQALALLEDPSDREREVLGAIRYQSNSAVLHTDTRVLPRSRRAWAAWNYRVRDQAGGPVAVTYNMNILQSLQARETYCVTLNPGDEIAEQRILRRLDYAHPVFTREAVRAQGRFAEISGQRGTHYAGAYWYNGFHEDGVRSALRVGRHFGRWLD